MSRKINIENFENRGHETHFPILNKIDRAWELRPELTFCELFWDILPQDLVGKKMKDIAYSKLLDDLTSK